MCSQGEMHKPVFIWFYLFLRQDHYVQSRQITCVVAETFPYGALDPVSGYGCFHRFPGNRQPQTRVRFAVPARKNEELRIPGTAGCLKNAVEIRGAVQSVFALETASFKCHGYARQADKRFLPLALRDFNICRPALVRMRTRNP